MNASCLNLSDPDIKALADAYGEVLASKIITKLNKVPTVEEARPLAEKYKKNPELQDPEIFASIKSQNEVVSEVINRWQNISEEYFTDEEQELYERYQTKDGQVRARRVTDITKTLFKGKRSAAETQRENERPNNKLLRELGTEMHLLMQGFMYDLINSSNVLDVRVHPKYAPLTSKPDWMSNDAYSSLKKGAQVIFEGMEERQKQLNDKTGKQEKGIVLLEATLDNKNDLAGTVDIMAVFSDGKIQIYDHKFTQPSMIKTVGPDGKPIYEESLDLTDIKRKSYRLQMSEYRKLLTNSYKISNDQIVKTTILPWFIDVSRSSELYEDGTKIQKGNPENKRVKLNKVVNNIQGIGDAEVKELPSGYELTENPVLDKILIKLYDKLENAITQTAKNYYSNPELSQKFSEETHLLERTIEEVTREKDIGVILEYLTNVSSWVLNNVDKIETNYLTTLYKEMAFYNDIISNVGGLNRLITDEEIAANPELSKQIQKNLFNIGQATTLVKNTQLLLEDQILQKLEQINPDITRASVRSSFRQFQYFSEIDDPVFNQAHTLITDQENVVKKKLDAFLQEVQSWKDKLGNSKLKEIYKKIRDPKTGNLIPKIDREFKKQEREAENDGNVPFFKDKYKITDEGKKKYKEDLERVKQTFEIQYSSNPEMMKVKIAQWEAANNLEKSDAAWLNRWARYKYTELVNEEQYYSQEYKNLDAESKEFYNWYFGKNKEFDKLVPERIRGNFIANVKRDAIDLLSDGISMNTPIQAMQIIKNNAKHALQLRKGDFVNVQGDPNALDIESPLLYMDNFEYWDKDMGDWRASYTKNEVPIEKNEDLLYNMTLFAESVYRRNAMNQISDTLDSLRTYLTYRKSFKKDILGQITINPYTQQPELEVEPKDLEEFNNMLRMQVRKESVVNKDYLFKVGKKTYSTNRLFNLVYSVIRNTALAFNWLPAIAGGLNGFLNVSMYADKNKYYNNKNYRRAVSMSITQRKKFDKVAKYLSVERENYTEREARKKTKTWLGRILNMDSFYTVYRVPEEYNSSVIGVSMADHYGIDPQTGNMVRLEDLPEGTKSLLDTMLEKMEDDNFSEEALPANVYDELRRKARSISRLAKGTNTDLDKSLAHGNIYIKGAMMFRNWVQPMLTTRVGAARYEPTLKGVEMGRYRTALTELAYNGKMLQAKTIGKIIHQAALSTPILGRMLSMNSNFAYKVNEKASEDMYERFIKNNPQHAGRITKEDYTQARQAELQSFHAEMRALVGVAGLLALLTMDSDEDGERDSADNGFTNLVYTLVDRLETEMSFFYNPNSFLEISKNAIPGAFFFRKIGGLFTNTFDEAVDRVFGEDELSKTGKNVDKTGPFHYTLQFIYGVRPLKDLIDTVFVNVEEEINESED